MGLFRKRWLSLILCIMLVTFSFFVCLPDSCGYIVGVIFFFIFLLVLILREYFKNKTLLLCVIMLAVFFSSLFGALWQNCFYPRDFYNTEVFMSGYVCSVDHTEPSYSTVVLNTSTLNGERNEYCIQIKGEKDILSGINKGDVISLAATVNSIESHFDGGDTAYLIAQGISAKAEDPKDVFIKDHIENVADNFFDGCRVFLGNRLKEFTNFKTGALISALITGERGDLDANTNLNFKRIGITHTLALSGMHLAIMTALLFSLLSVFGINKRIKSAITIIFTLFYMMLTGFSSSVTRAGIMLIICYFLSLLYCSSDGVTSLFLSVFIIVSFEPTAVFDISLLLSAFATLGILVFSEISDRKKKEHGFIFKIFLKLFNLFLSSVFAITSCFFIIIIAFDEISVVSLFTTVIFSALIELLIYGGILCLAVGWFIPISYVLIPFSNFIRLLAEVISSQSWVQVPINNLPVKILSYVTVIVFFVLIIFANKRWRKLIFAISSALLCIVFILASCLSIQVRNENDLIYSTNNNSDSFFIKSDGEISVICSGTGSKAWIDMLNLLDYGQITFLDNLVFADYGEATKENIQTVIDNIKTKTVYLPAPDSETEKEIAENVADLLSGYGTSVDFCFPKKALKLGDVAYIPIQRNVYSNKNSPQTVFTLNYNGKYFTYFSNGACEASSKPIISLINYSYALIIGNRGSENFSFDILSQAAEKIFLTEKHIVSDYAKEYYEKKNIAIVTVKDKRSLMMQE